MGFGTETDIRDLAGDLVIAHDPPAIGALSAAVFFDLYVGSGTGLPLALNVKSDGLQTLLRPLVERFELQNWFVFDMSIPDGLGWIKIGAPVYTRHSEIETAPAFYDSAAGVWLDGFARDWWTAETIRRHLDAAKSICVVSPELHGRDARPAWDRLFEFRADPRVSLCTDCPEEARAVFRG